MYQKAYGIIETLAPLHVGASAGEETGNLNLIFRDQFTQTGIIPGSSIRGRFRADMRQAEEGSEHHWYGHSAQAGEENSTTEAVVKFEYASIVWLPVFCPGQPIVWVSCPSLLKRYQMITQRKGEEPSEIPKPYVCSPSLHQGRQVEGRGKILFFNLGFLEVKNDSNLPNWAPPDTGIRPGQLVVVDDKDIAMIHDMSLYRQSRVRLEDDQKKVDKGGFFNVEALPEGTILICPIALKESKWQPLGAKNNGELYFGGLESIGFGRCYVSLGGEYFA